MFESPLPLYEDVRKVFLQGKSLSGFLALERLPRLLELGDLSAEQASVLSAEVELSFDLGGSGQRQIRGRARLRLPVTCQRCLEPVDVDLYDDIALVVIDDESLAARLEPQWDPWVIDDPKLDLAELVEEQLILCMPIVSMHTDPECEPAIREVETVKTSTQGQVKGLEGDTQSGKENPFAVLAKLKNDKD